MRRLLLSLLIVPIMAHSTPQSDEPIDEQPPESMPVLQAYRNYYTEAADFSLSFIRYRYRGYDAKYTDLYINDIPQNSLLSGTPSWGALGSMLSLLTPTTTLGSSVAAGGGRWFNSAPALAVQGGKAVAALSNRTYSYRMSAGYNLTTNNGWAVNVDASRRFGRSLTTDGLFADAWGLYVSAAKSLKNNNITATVMFAPSQRALASPSTDEAFRITSSNLYNPAWGLQNGNQRSTKVRTTIEPVVIVNHVINITPKIVIKNAVEAQFGIRRNSSIGWQGAPNPLPDYYRYMPSMQQSEIGAQTVQQLWLNDINTRQINFENLFYINRINDGRAKYIVENRVEQPLAISAQSAIHTPNLDAAISLRYESSRNYKTVEDLLGANHWLDIDSYVQQDEDIKELVQNNVRNPNRKVTTGQRFGYDYRITAMQARAWGRYKFQTANWRLSATAQIGLNTLQRYGFYEKENFPSGRSYGFSQPHSVVEYGARLEGEYRLGTLFSVGAAINFENRAPTVANLFIEPRYRNFIAPQASPEQIFSAQIVSQYRSEKISARVAFHYANFESGTELRSMYDDMSAQYISYAMYDISRRHLGVEASAEMQLYGALYLHVALFIQNNIYSDNPRAVAYRESTGEVLRQDEVVAYDGLHTPLSPQTAAVVALTYRPRGWIVRLSSSIFADNYVALSPLRRTFAATTATASSEALQAMTIQQRLPAGAVVDLFAGYTWRFDGSSLGLYAGVNNVLNNRKIVSAGYESGRLRNVGSAYDRLMEPMPSKYYYALPINFFVNVTYRF